MGIDQQVQGIVSQYRQNPQGLQQKYGQNKQLVDLLALQKLKSEKEAAAREMQMKMSPQPQTIAQQREQEVMNLTRNEVAQQVGSTMQQQEKERQKRLQMMQGMGMPKQGIAGAMPQRPPQPQQRMASGGIVALSGGGETMSEWEKQERQRLKDKGVPPDEIERLIKGARGGTGGIIEWARGLMDKQRGGRGLERVYAKEGKADPTNVPLMGGDQTIRPNPPEPAPVADGAEPAPTGIDAVAQSQGTPSVPFFEQYPAPKAPKAPSADAGSQTVSQPADSWGTEAQKEAYRYAKQLADTDAAGRLEADREDYKSIMAPAVDAQNQQNSRTAELEALLKKQQDPQKLKREQLLATLSGIANTRGTSFGAAAAGAMPGYLNRVNKQEKEARSGIKSLRDWDKDSATNTTNMQKGVFDAGIAGRNSAEDLIQSGSESMRTVANTARAAESQDKATEQRAIDSKIYQLAAAGDKYARTMVEAVEGRQAALVELSNSPDYIRVVTEIDKLNNSWWLGDKAKADLAKLEADKVRMERQATEQYDRVYDQAEKMLGEMSRRINPNIDLTASRTGSDPLGIR